MNDFRSVFAFVLVALLIGAGGCSDDPTAPEEPLYLDVDITNPYLRECPDAPYLVSVEANLPLERVEFRVDRELIITDFTAPFEYLWNLALWADGRRHTLTVEGYDTENRNSYGGFIDFRIPAGVGGLLLSPAPNGGVADAAAAELRWLREPGATEFTVEVGRDPNFTGPATVVTTSDTTATVGGAALEWQYWRVRQREGDGPWGPWSETGAFFGGALFERDYVVPGAGHSIGHTVKQTTDGGFFVAGSYTYSTRPIVLRLDAMGEPLWSYEPYIKGAYYDLVVTGDGGCALTGIAYPEGRANMILTRLDAEGRELWSRPYFGSDGTDYGRCIIACAAGGFLVAGTRDNEQAWLLRSDEDGWAAWEKTYAASSAEAVVELSGGQFVFTGAIYGDHQHLTGTDSSGNQLWQTTTYDRRGVDLAATESGFVVLDYLDVLTLFDIEGQFLSRIGLDRGIKYNALGSAPNGGFCVGGEQVLLGFDAAGQELWRKDISGTTMEICPTGDGGLAAVGYRRGTNTYNQLWLLRTGGQGMTVPPILD